MNLKIFQHDELMDELDALDSHYEGIIDDTAYFNITEYIITKTVLANP